MREKYRMTKVPSLGQLFKDRLFSKMGKAKHAAVLGVRKMSSGSDLLKCGTRS